MSCFLDSQKPVLLMTGATASGKSAIASEIAKNGAIWIINADSMQIYKEIPILSAQPSSQEQENIPHRLYGHVAGQYTWSVAQWADEVMKQISQAHQQGVIPFIVGGTGLYFHALTQGLAVIPEIDPEIRKTVREIACEQGSLAIYDLLSAEDPLMAQRLHSSDTQRLSRALEVIRSTGESLSVWQDRKMPVPLQGYTVAHYRLDTDRTWLNERIHRRFDIMMGQGALEEVEALLTCDLPVDSPVWKAVGTRELAYYLQGEWSLDEAIERAKISSRQYAKRQTTWFRGHFSDWQGLDAGNPETAVQTILKILSS